MESDKVVLQSVFEYIDSHRDHFIRNLRDAISIPSVSAVFANREDVKHMMDHMAKQLQELDVNVEMCHIGKQKISNGTHIHLPPVILGTLGQDPSKPTILIYGHLDVHPASKRDGWNSPPFSLVVQNGRMYGRGTTDDKGPTLAWLHVVEAHRNTMNPLPVNLKFCFEGMGESGSRGLENLLKERKSTFLNDVDYVCITDGYWLGTQKPCLLQNLRGTCVFTMKIKCAEKLSYSRAYGGSSNQATTDLNALFDSLVDDQGNILVPGIMDAVQSIAVEEFDVEDNRKETGAERSSQSPQEEVFMARWRFPSLTIENVHRSPATKSVTPPHTVVRKFSIRLVADQDPGTVSELVKEYLDQQLAARGSTNTIELHTDVNPPPWEIDPKHPHFQAAVHAINEVYEVEPDFIRGGDTISVLLTLAEITDKNVLALSMGRGDDGARAPNEKLDIDNYIKGTKVMAAYMYEVAKIGKSAVASEPESKPE